MAAGSRLPRLIDDKNERGKGATTSNLPLLLYITDLVVQNDTTRRGVYLIEE